jgi:hypothetical protein
MVLTRTITCLVYAVVKDPIGTLNIIFVRIVEYGAKNDF